MVNQMILNWSVLFLWVCLAILTVCKIITKPRTRIVRKIAIVSGGLSSLTALSFHCPTPVYAQSIDSDSWKNGESQVEVSPPTAVLSQPLISDNQVPVELDKIPTSVHERKYVVVVGDNFWTIAKRQVPQGQDIVSYWEDIIALNKASLISKNPNLIYPGEEIVLRSGS